MRRLDFLAALVAVAAVAFLACSPDPLDEAVPQSGGTSTPDQLVCTVCGASPPAAEIDGRVLVCADCWDDAEVRAHARKDWR